MPQRSPEENDFARRLGTALRELREAQGLTQEDLAEDVGTSAAQIGRWERGSPPKSYMLAKLWRALGEPKAGLLFDAPAVRKAPEPEIRKMIRRAVAEGTLRVVPRRDRPPRRRAS